ncbi:MAG: aminotransferase class IV [Dehalococcoidales bacterium]|nr:aminotransferase class IV [Dehalococcoidales bacterium]
MEAEMTTTYVSVDGDLQAASGRHLSALDRGFTLGDGAFETIRVARGKPFRWQAHLARLRGALEALHLPLAWSDERLAEAVAELLAANGLREAVVRVTVSRGVPRERGLLPQGDSATVVVQTSPFRALPAERIARGVRAHTSAIRRNETSPTSRLKTCNYLDNVLALLEARRHGADEAILLNTAGYLACASAANLHIVRGGRILTPALACGVLPGITREAVRELSAALGLVWEETWLRPADLEDAEEAFLTNSVGGVLPLTIVDGQAIGSGHPGQLTLLLRQQHEESQA